MLCNSKKQTNYVNGTIKEARPVKLTCEQRGMAWNFRSFWNRKCCCWKMNLPQPSWKRNNQRGLPTAMDMLHTHSAQPLSSELLPDAASRRSLGKLSGAAHKRYHEPSATKLETPTW